VSYLVRIFQNDLAIDLGTANTLIASVDRGVVLDEPSVVAVRAETGRILSGGCAVGHLARRMEGRTGENISIVRPLADGVIAEYRQCEAMVRYFLAKVGRQPWQRRPRVIVGVPGGISAVHRRAVFNSLHRAGARQVFLLPEATAAALGVGLPIAEPVAGMVCDIGGGTTETAVFSLTERIAAESIPIAGDAMDRAIVDYLRRTFSLRISISAAEQLRIDGGSAYPLPRERTLTAAGLDAIAGAARRADVTTEELRHALEEPLEAILDSIRRVVDRAGPDLASDLVDRGLVLCGGAAVLPGLDRYVTEQTGLPARVAPEPRRAVIDGMLICLEQFAQWRGVLQSSEDDV